VSLLNILKWLIHPIKNWRAYKRPFYSDGKYFYLASNHLAIYRWDFSDEEKKKMELGLRKKEKRIPILNTLKNHHIEELKLSLRIAKTNLKIDPSNKYYLSELDKTEIMLREYQSPPQ
jgi:hypothetical protein